MREAGTESLEPVMDGTPGCESMMQKKNGKKSIEVNLVTFS